MKECIALASYPRSGNTWVRYLLERATGEPTGTIYTSHSGKVVMPHRAEGIVIKTHKADCGGFDRTIHLVRNPFDTFESFFYWHLDWEGNSDLTWDEHIPGCIRTWRYHTLYWLHAPIPTYLLRYEDLHSNATGSMRALLAWLDFPCSGEAIARAVAEADIHNMRERFQGSDDFFRRGTVGDGIRSFSDGEIANILTRLGGLMVQCGYRDMVRELSEEYI